MSDRLLYRIIPRTDTAENWETANPILQFGEMGTATYPDGTSFFKIGDGETHWHDLKTLSGERGPKGDTGPKGADGADFTTHIAKQASPSVEGHVKLDALAANGSNTAAPGGYGLGVFAPISTDLNTIVGTQFFRGGRTTANSPVSLSVYGIHIQYSATAAVQEAWTHESPPRKYSRCLTTSVWGDWTLLPKGITDSTSTVASDIAASATAVKTAYGAASDAQTDASTALARTAPATPEKAGTVKPGKGVAVTNDGTLNVSYWDAFPPFIPVPIWGVAFGGSDGRRAIMPGEATAREDWILCDGGSDGKGGKVPNLVGRVPLGASSSYTAGSTGGSATHEHTVTGDTGGTTLSTAQMASHSHTVTAGYRGGGTGVSDGGPISLSNETRTTSTVGSNASHLHSMSVSTSTTSNMMPYCALYYVIRII